MSRAGKERARAELSARKIPMKIQVNVPHQLWTLDGVPGPVAGLNQIFEVKRTVKINTGLVSAHSYYLVEVDGAEYASWPPHSRVIT